MTHFAVYPMGTAELAPGVTQRFEVQTRGPGIARYFIIGPAQSLQQLELDSIMVGDCELLWNRGVLLAVLARRRRDGLHIIEVQERMPAGMTVSMVVRNRETFTPPIDPRTRAPRDFQEYPPGYGPRVLFSAAMLFEREEIR